MKFELNPCFYTEFYCREKENIEATIRQIELEYPEYKIIGWNSHFPTMNFNYYVNVFMVKK